jgi:hypothetical protein
MSAVIDRQQGKPYATTMSLLYRRLSLIIERPAKATHRWILSKPVGRL